MASGRIQGITIEIDGNTTKLSQSLKSVDGQINETQKALKDINKLLKLDPGNVELLTQKQKNLTGAIENTEKRLKELKDAQSNVAKGTDEWDRLQREIIATEQDLDKLKSQYKDFGSVAAQQIAAAGQKMEDFGNKVSKAGDALMPLSKAATGALGALGGMAYKAVSSADELNTLSKQTGFTTEEIQKMKYASDLVDVSFEDIEGALKKLKPKITDNNKVLADLGVTTKNADGSTRDATDVFYDAIEALSKITNETDRDQKAMELFGKSADSLAGIIDDGGAALKAYGKEAEDLGIIMGQDTVDSLSKVNDTLDKLKGQAGGALGKLGGTVAEVLAPSLEKLLGIVGKVTDAISKLTPEQAETILKVLAITAAIGPLLKTGGKLISGVGKALKLAPKIATAVKVVGAALSPTTLIIAAVVAAVVALGVIIYKNWDKIKAWTLDMVAKIKAAWENAKEAISNTVNNIKDTIVNVWTNIKASVTTTISDLTAAIAEKWENIKTTVAEKVSGIVQKVKDLFSFKFSLPSSHLPSWSEIKQTLSDIVDNVKGLFNFDFKLPGLKLPTWTEIKTTLDDIVKKAKEAFDFNWSLPHIKLPHFKVQGGKWPYGLGGEGYLPSISIDWYRRAYQNAVMFTRPTVLQTSQGLKGFGDGTGAEIVMGINKLRELVGASQNVVVNVYGAQGQSVDALADAVTRRIVNMQRQRNSAYA